MTIHPQHPDQWADEPTTDLERLMATPPGGARGGHARLPRGRAPIDWADRLDTSLHYGHLFADQQAGVEFDDDITQHLETLTALDIERCVWALLDFLALTHHTTVLVSAFLQYRDDPATRRGLGYVRLARRVDESLLEGRAHALLGTEVDILREAARSPRQMWTDLLAAAEVLT